MEIRCPWDVDPPPPAPPRDDVGPNPRGRRRRTLQAASAAEGWLYHHLTISGPADRIAAFAAAARGAGVPEERFRVEAVERSPEFDPAKAPKLDPVAWPEARWLKGNHNYGVDYLGHVLQIMERLFGTLVAAQLIERGDTSGRFLKQNQISAIIKPIRVRL